MDGAVMTSYVLFGGTGGGRPKKLLIKLLALPARDAQALKRFATDDFGKLHQLPGVGSVVGHLALQGG